MKKEKIGVFLLLILSLMTITAMFFINPILQKENYHLFSDSRSLMNIPNFWNVISNYPFVIVGGLGVVNFVSIKKSMLSYMLLFSGIILVAIGSGYYHLFPSTQSLVWDRLPMTIVFMTLFSIVIGEYVSEMLGRLSLLPLILIGLFSVGYWIFSESGDLRIYALVQFYPMLSIPIILIFFKSKYSNDFEYWTLLGAYVIAKLLEYFDLEIYKLLGFISGHSLKHLVAALGLYVLLNAYKKRNLDFKKNLEKPLGLYTQLQKENLP